MTREELVAALRNADENTRRDRLVISVGRHVVREAANVLAKQLDREAGKEPLLGYPIAGWVSLVLAEIESAALRLETLSWHKRALKASYRREIEHNCQHLRNSLVGD